ncbi:MAG: hypothetical protein AAB618_01985 [Patescibacteria group bacterium]
MVNKTRAIAGSLKKKISIQSIGGFRRNVTVSKRRLLKNFFM